MTEDEAAAGRSVREWLRDIEQRLRRVEKFMYALGGAVALLEFLRACTKG